MVIVESNFGAGVGFSLKINLIVFHCFHDLDACAADRDIVNTSLTAYVMLVVGGNFDAGVGLGVGSS
jgi:hypothetical protein